MVFICHNLDLGGTIWLNVSRKFLSFNKFFFKTEDCYPCGLREEIAHHSHTHSTSASYNSSTVAHVHTISNTQSIGCGVAGAPVHLHANDDLDAGQSHLHAFTVNLAAGNVGALPNWQTHVHACSAATCSNTGGVHTHTHSGVTWDGFCAKAGCSTIPHSHTIVVSTGNSGTNHTHTLSGNSANANTAGKTCLSHDHNFGPSVSWGDDHLHAVNAPATSFDLCRWLGNHSHSGLSSASSSTESHSHTLSGVSGLSSEDPLCTPTVAGKLWMTLKGRGGDACQRLNTQKTLKKFLFVGS